MHRGEQQFTGADAVTMFREGMDRLERNHARFTAGLPIIDDALTQMEESVGAFDSRTRPFQTADPEFAEKEAAVVDAVRSLRRYVDRKQSRNNRTA